jgi:DNA-binding transcriptional LysR family regulator
VQRGEHGELVVGVSLPFNLLADLFEQFRKDFGGVSVEIVESTSAANWALVQQRRVDVAFGGKCNGNEAAHSLHLRDESMAAALPKSHPLASMRSVKLEELSQERFVFCAGGLGPDIEEHLVRRTARLSVKPKVQLHRVGQCNLLNMVAMGFGVTLVVGPAPCAATDGVVLVPLAGRHIVPLNAVWMESNPNPALKALLNIAQQSGPVGAARR